MRMSGALLAALAACAAGPSSGPAARTIALHNAGFEQPAEAGRNCAPGWGCTQHSDPTAFRFVIDREAAVEGRQSLRIEPSGREPWAIASQGLRDPGLRGSRLRVSFAMRLENVVGVGAGPFVQAQDGSGGRIATEQRLFAGTESWSRRALEFVVPAGMHILEVGVMLHGTGRVWIDDVRLEVLESEGGAKKPV